MRALALDRVLMVVANLPWQKAGRPLAPAAARLAVLEGALAGVEGLEASKIELDRGGESNTADTLEELAAADPSPELFLIVGGDVAEDIASWRRVDVVRALATLVVVNRPGAPDPRAMFGPETGWRVATVEIPQLAVSSTELRARLAEGRPLDFLIPMGALHRIADLGLYAGGR